MTRRQNLVSWIMGIVLLVALIVACAPAATPATPTPKPAAAPTSPVPVAEKPKSGGTLRVAYGAEPASIDFTRRAVIQEAFAWEPLHSGIVAPNPPTWKGIVPDLAESWQVSPDGTIYTFKIKKAQWHDGKPVTAEDLRYNLWRMRTQPNKLPQPRLGSIRIAVAAEEVMDESTLKVTLTRPYPWFLGTLALPWTLMQPKHVLEKADNENARDVRIDEVLGAGAFRLKSFQVGIGFVYEKNKDFHRPGLPYLDNIEMYFMPSKDAWIAAFKTGRIDMHGPWPTPTVEQAEEMEKSEPGKYKAVRLQTPSLMPLYMNVNKPPFNEVRLRRAVHLGIDKKAMGDAVFGPGKWIYTAPVPIGYDWVYPPDEWLKKRGVGPRTPEDLAEAKRLVDEVSGGKGVKAELLVRTVSNYPPMAENAVAQLREVGFDVKLRPMESTAGREAVLAGDFQLYLEVWSAEVNDPMFYHYIVYMPGGGGYYVKWQNPEHTKLYNEQMAELDQAKRGAFFRKMADIILDEVPITPLPWELRTAIENSEVRNYSWPVLTHSRYRFDQVWLDPGRRFPK